MGFSRPLVSPEMWHEIPMTRSQHPSLQAKDNRDSCSTCEIIGKLTEGFWDLTPQVEAVYIEHLVREHDIQP
jgi:hypothetical protein